ncbi:hypothetical protein KKF05_01190 [Patescibacteria group bacterium]|nr:hypothetical protein [Patescibacteria group bacterium]MBU1029265.1 hypothetical protein [Patescibacteria group bacterium]MBU1916342.1 hypothetical protein [Patescibacteria group bacterium]
MTKTIVKLLARHLYMDLRENLTPNQDDLSQEPGVWLIGSLTTPHLKWLYGLADQAHTRYRYQLGTLASSIERDQTTTVRLRPLLALINTLLMLFEYAVRQQFNIPDETNIAVTRDWQVFGYTPERTDCSGDCDECQDCDDCSDHDQHDCGENCKSRGGSGCGRPDCQCEDPTGIKQLNLTISTEESQSFGSTGKMLLGIFTLMRKREPQADQYHVTLKIPKAGYRSIKVICRILQQICDQCEQDQAWCSETPPEQN